MRLAVVLLSVAAVALTAPVDATRADAHAANVGFLQGVLADHDPDALARFVDGRVMPLSDAIELAAARAEGVDLSSFAGRVGTPRLTTVAGDVWVIEEGDGPCIPELAAEQPFYVPAHQTFRLYPGGIGSLRTTHGDFTLAIGWTMQWSFLAYETRGFTAHGSQDFFCFEVEEGHFAFPFVDGVVRLNG